MKETIVKQLNQEYRLVERDLGEFARLKKNGMTFNFSSYEIEGVGNVSFIDMKAMLGLMKMETVVFSPLCKDAPLFSFDYINAFKNETLFMELYDIQLGETDLKGLDAVKEKYAYLKDHDPGEHWYDHLMMSPSLFKRDKNKKADYALLTEEFFREYLKLVKGSADVDRKQKQAKIEAYVDGLLSNGGPATDQFVKLFGKDKTTELFKRFVFSAID